MSDRLGATLLEAVPPAVAIIRILPVAKRRGLS
jgi:hypothetical protein